MAHGLETKSSMLFNQLTGDCWHGLGVPIQGLATAGQVMESVDGFNTDILKLPAQFDGKDVPGHYFTVRSDNRKVLGHVGEEYRVIQNRDMLQVMEAITMDPHGPMFETAGVLWGGSKAWVLAKFPEDMIVKGRKGVEDIVSKYLLMSQAHDGSQRLVFMLTDIRVVCNNTHSAAMSQKDINSSVSVCHSGDTMLKMRNVANVLNVTFKHFAELGELYQRLADVEPTKAQIAEVFDRLIPPTVTKRSDNQRARVLTLAEAGTGNAPFAGTAWGLYNGFTELVDHHNNAGSTREDANDMRVYNKLFDSGARFKDKALYTIAEVCLN